MRQLWVVFGVGVLLTQTACGAIIYSGPQDILINQSYPDVGLDLDGAPPGEFVFEYIWDNGEMELTIEGWAAGGRFFACEWLGPLHGPPARMNAGDEVREDLLWLSTKDEGLLAGFYGTWWGGRFVGEAGYVGVKFQLTDGWHYGWIGYQAENDASEGLITGWAFETIPDEPIEAGRVPEPATIALLATGITFLHRRYGYR